MSINLLPPKRRLHWLRIVLLLLLLACVGWRLRAWQMQHTTLTADAMITPSPASPPMKVAMPLKTVLIPLQGVSAQTVTTLLRNPTLALLSAGGGVAADVKQHVLWLHDDAKHIQCIRRLLKQLQRPSPQVLLQSRIVSIDEEALRDLGVIFQSSSKVIAGSAERIVVPIVKLGTGVRLEAKLSALVHLGHAEVVASPEVVTVDRHTAVIESGDEVPYQQETAGGGTNVAFKKAVLRLAATPTLLGHHKILLRLQVNQDKVSALTVKGVPAIHTQQLETQVILRNHQTFILGGIYEQARANQLTGIPVLRKIPLLGGLFRDHQRIRKRRELFIFVTVSIQS